MAVTAADFSQPGTEKARIPWRLPVKHFSASSLKMGAECPEKFRQRYLLKTHETKTPNLVVGSAFHGALAFNFESKIKTGVDLDESDLQDAYAESWASACRREEIDWQGEDPRVFLDQGYELTKLYVAQVAPRIQPLAVEQSFRVRAIEGVPVPLHGFIDLITPSGFVDYKTSARKITQMKSEWLLQGRIYQMVKPVEFSWHVIAKTKEPTIWTPLEAPGLALPYRDNAIQAMKTYIRDLAFTLNYYYVYLGPGEPWPTNGIPSNNCARCSYLPHCPGWAR